MTSLLMNILLFFSLLFSIPNIKGEESNNQSSQDALEDFHTITNNKEQPDQEPLKQVIDEDIEDVSIVSQHKLKSKLKADASEYTKDTNHLIKPTIDSIIVLGNQQVGLDAILNKIPYHLGEVFTPIKSKQLISNLMDMEYFKKVSLKGELLPDNKINLYILLTEKQPLKEVIFKGNKHLLEKDIKKKIKFNEKPAIDESDLRKFINDLKKLYREKNYHNVAIEAHLEDAGQGKVNAVFTIDENKKSSIQRVFFEGNKAFSAKELRGLIFTREDWVLGFMDKSGFYQPEAIEADRHMLENFYQSRGYLNAKVKDVAIQTDPNDSYNLKVTFHIQEGDIYTINDIKIAGSDVISNSEILSRLPIKVGDLYSKEKIRDSIELIRLLLGEYGYIYADVDPAIEPDNEKKTVNITFFTELGDKTTVRKIEIRGNKKTRQKIIRRQLLVDEGDLLTTQRLEKSKERIEQLGYFDQQNGVSWKIKRVSQDIADLELFVNEVKTGRVDMQLGFGGSPRDLQNPTESLRVGGSISDTNLLGLGIGFNLSGEFSKQERQLLFNITEPWLFDRPIFAALDLAIKKSLYEDFQFTQQEVKEQVVNGSFSVGFIAQQLNMTRFLMLFGVEGVHYNPPPQVNTSAIPDPKEAAEFAMILQRRFPQGSFAWTGGQASQDFRNHPMHPSRGYQWLIQTRMGIPNSGHFHLASAPQASPYNFGFWKLDGDASYYTPLIGERDLVFYFHTHFGIVGSFPGKVVPYRELYHIGGPASVRGFLFGEIGPTYKGVDSIGAKKAFWFNAELIFPVAPDFSIKGIVFYDGGAGWDTPDSDSISKKRLKNNNFNYRHSVGFGVRLLRPTPMRIDWGFKLDKRKGESPSEVHLTMSHDF